MMFLANRRRRQLSLALAATLFAGSGVATAAPVAAPAASNPAPALQASLDAFAKRAQPATLGVAVIDLNSGATWGVNASQAFPMMSDFKAPVAAAILARIDAGAMSLTQTVELARADIIPGSAVPSIGSKFQGERMRFTVAELMRAAVTESDNTAVDALLVLLGGPARFTEFMRSKGVAHMVATENERGLTRYTLAQRAAPAGSTLAPPPNSTTPAASALFLKTLWANKLLSPGSTAYLLDMMYAQVIPTRLRRGLPPGARLADKTGTAGVIHGKGSFNDMGLFTWPDGRAVIVTVYLTGSTASQDEMETLFGDIARTATTALAPPAATAAAAQ